MRKNMMDKWPHSAIYIPGSIGEYELTSRNQEINEITLPCHQNISDSEDSRILLEMVRFNERNIEA
ncbi:hypothetical protein EWB00_010354 [Schistosoma japonicum]|uniref:Uncharacterized protein n=1 Tax=Schistosoma japonicum TaxID=6182 RepID=A0A4Z2DPA3_SCHJA|nr:hypothetical protein EWB00_010354 [Schistosoma japonicum]